MMKTFTQYCAAQYFCFYYSILSQYLYLLYAAHQAEINCSYMLD